MGYRAATDLFTKFYGEKDGDSPRTSNIDFSRFMASRMGLNFGGGYPPPMGNTHYKG